MLVRHLAAQRVAEEVLQDRLLRTLQRLIDRRPGSATRILVLIAARLLGLNHIVSEYFLQREALVVRLTDRDYVCILLAHFPLKQYLLWKALDASIYGIERKTGSPVAVIFNILHILLAGAVLIIDYVLRKIWRCLELFALKMLQLGALFSRLIQVKVVPELDLRDRLGPHIESFVERLLEMDSIDHARTPHMKVIGNR